MSRHGSPSLVSVVAESASRFGQRPALAQSQGAGESGLTYAQLWDHIGRGAAFLQASGLEPGDRILLLAEVSPDWPAAFFSILHAGMVAVPVTTDTAPEIVGVICRHAAVAAVLHTERTAASIEHLNDIRRVSLPELFANGAPLATSHTLRGSDLAMLGFTSGSTQQPRAVELTHANLLADLEAMLQTRKATPDDVFLSMLPPAHLFELMGGLLGPLACGAKIIYPGAPLPNRLVDSLNTDGITHACCVPGLLQFLYHEVFEQLVACGFLGETHRHDTVAQTAERFESVLTEEELDQLVAGIRARIGNSLRVLVLGGAALDPAWVPILTRLGISIEVGYGLTEASPIVSMGEASECPPRSVGRPLPGVSVQIDSTGEILIRGPSVTAAYHLDEGLNETAFTDGWLRTGDRGVVDDDGFLFITGRVKEAMVTAAGETIYPDEVEPYYSSPLFAEWCVAGLPGPQGNDLPTLFVVPSAPDIGSEELDRAFRDLRSVAPSRMRVDRMIRLHHPIPRTALGKPKRRAVAESSLQEKTETDHA